MKSARMCSENEQRSLDSGSATVLDRSQHAEPCAASTRKFCSNVLDKHRANGAIRLAVLSVGAGLALCAVAAAGCGASIQAVYEGDVRFEHCMALDQQANVKTMIKRACWTEWIAFYTYGQTRDRVKYAQRRVAILNGAVPADTSTSVESDEPPEPRAGGLLTVAMGGDKADAGGAGPPSAETASVDAGPTARRSRCLAECVAMRDDCRRQCDAPNCEKNCSVRHSACADECGP
jgi:hypothetical protein